MSPLLEQLLNDLRSRGTIALRKGLRRYFSTACSREPHRPVTFSRFNTVCLLLWLHLQHCLLQSCLRDAQPDRTNWPEAPTDFLRPSAGTICHCWVNSRESSSRLHDLEVLLASSTRNDCRLLCSHSKDTRGELYKQRKRDHMGHFSCFSPLTANYMTFLLQRQRTFSLLFFFFDFSAYLPARLLDFHFTSDGRKNKVTSRDGILQLIAFVERSPKFH